MLDRNFCLSNAEPASQGPRAININVADFQATHTVRWLSCI